MNRKVILTCAVTGAGDTTGKSEHVPVSPEEIANDAIAAARAGASVVHIHVRDLETKQGSREVSYYREVVRRIRASDVDPVINLTAGMGGDLVIDPQDPLTTMPGTDLINALDRLPHVEELLPEICTIDCGSLNFGEGSNLYVSTPDMLREGSKRIQTLGCVPRWRSSTPAICGSPTSSSKKDSSTPRRCTSCAWASPTVRPPIRACWLRW